VSLLIATGMRRGELWGMRGEHIDWERGLVLIEGKGMKRRWVAPGSRALQALSACRNGTGPVWLDRHGQPYSRDALYEIIRRLGQRAGVKTYIHKFRTTYANGFAEKTNGDWGSLQVILGHSKLETTLGYAAWGRAERALEQMRRYAG